MRNSSRSVKIVNGELVIKVGIDTLAWAFDHMEDNNPYSDELGDYEQKWKVSDHKSAYSRDYEKRKKEHNG